ncbi:phage antirepressor Ant [Kocuria sp. WRN011]|uniref:phage antirepressor n=1 Tax=Kocuria sp. WRN011 TaxID=2029858 RepID=UPI000BAE6BB8|nr:phage antirepressor [Kocuria sp. WRN011]PBB08444.1 phage antirepressor Ant [Kocuria sp. WRN011]
MNQQLATFMWHGDDLRVVEVNGEPWFVASDVSKVLNYRNAPDLTRRIEEEDKGYAKVRTPGGDQEVSVLNESGLYDAIFRSNAEGAKPFRRWVTNEVLPSVRKHGGYLTDSKLEEVLTDPDTLIRLATDLKEERAARVRAEKDREAMASYAQELEPKSEAYDAFISADGTYSIGNVAKMHGISQNKIFTMMRNNGVMIAKGAMRNTPYQKYMHHFAVKAYEFERHDGTSGISYTTRVQPSGVDFLRRKLGLAQVAEQTQLITEGEAA